jgi:tight adherence protein C
MFSLTDANINLLIATASAVSAFLSIVLVTWPYLMPDTLGARMKKVRDEREAIRRRERSKLYGGEQPSLRTEPKKIFKDILDRLNLWEEINNTTMVKKLRMAGYRGQSPIVTFVAFRVIVPGVIFVATALFAFVIPKQAEYPFFARLSAVMAATLIGYYLPALFVRNKVNKRQTAIRRSWPDALDLLLICVESGMGLESAVAKVADEIVAQCPELSQEFALMTAELSYFAGTP